MIVLRSIAQDNTTMPGSPSRLGLSMQSEQPSRGEGPVKLSTTNLYIKGLPADTTDQSLRALCNRHGTILSTKAVLDPQTHNCKGFGFVDFEKAECAQAALESLRLTGYQVGMAKKQEQADTNVFFKNLPENFTKEDLESWVKECGVVSSVHIMKQNGRSMGVGFARMACKADCEKIIQKYNNLRLPGSKEPLLVKFADVPNRTKNHLSRPFIGQEFQGAMAFPAGPTSFILSGPPPQGSFSLGAPAYTEHSGVGAMTMTAPTGPQVSGLHTILAMNNVPMAQYPSLTAANYGFVSMAPAAAPYPTLQAQYSTELQLQQSAPQLFMPSATGMQQVVPGMQAPMDPIVSGMPQWQ